MEQMDFSRKDDLGKLSLAYQINRTATIMSEKLDAGSSDIMRSQKILINAKLNAVDTLSRMLQFYLKDEGKWEIMEDMENDFKKEFDKEKDSSRSMLMKEEYAEKKFGFLMEFISIKGWFLEEGIQSVIK